MSNTTKTTSSAGSSANPTCSTGAASSTNETKPTGVNTTGLNESAGVNTSVPNPTNTGKETRPTGANTGINESSKEAINEAARNTSATGANTSATGVKPTGVNTDANKGSGAINTDASGEDYYHLLGVSKQASNHDIEHAYKRLASKWHPSRHQDNRVEAQRHFNDLTQAFSVLSNAARRDHYDQLTSHKFTKDEALKTFERFFKQNGVLEDQEHFFDQHYPQRKQNFYEVLGVKRNASFQDIEAAFRKLGIEHHPKNKAGSKESELKFKEICEAYATLSDAAKRRNYDNFEFGELPAHYAHKQFHDYFENVGLEEEHDKKVLEPLVKKASLKKQQGQAPSKKSHHEQAHQQHPLGQHPGHEHHQHQPHVHHFSEQITKETFQEKTPEGVHTKSITHKSSIVNGRKVEVTVEEVTKPDGTTQVTETVKDGKTSKINKFELKDGQRKAIEG